MKGGIKPSLFANFFYWKGENALVRGDKNKATADRRGAFCLLKRLRYDLRAPRRLTRQFSRFKGAKGGNLMQLIQTVVVKQILTEKSREKLLKQYNAKRLQLQKECDQLQFELKRLEKTKTFSPNALKKNFEKEIQMRHEKEKLLEFQIEQLHMLPLGSEIKEKEVQALVDIKIGDVWNEKVGQPTIIIKDGIIEEIR